MKGQSLEDSPLEDSPLEDSEGLEKIIYIDPGSSAEGTPSGPGMTLFGL